MTDSRLERLAPLSGLVTIILFVTGTVLIGLYDFMPPADEVAEHLSANAARVAAGSYLGALSTFFLIWFAGSVRATLREKEGGTGWISQVAFGGGLAGSVVMILSFAGLGSAALRAGADGGINAVGAITVYDLWSQIGGLAFPFFMAVFIGATAAVSLRTNIFPAWFNWASLLVTLALLTPFSYLAIAPATIWILVVSIWLYVRGRSVPETAQRPNLI